MTKFFLLNINIDGSGAVVAAPDYNTPGGSYYYHWARDGALTMGALLRIATDLDDIREKMDAYVEWVKRVPHTTVSDPNNLDSVLPEPKYEIPNGTVFTGGWCRPQNDGPPLRAKTLIEYANALVENAGAGVSTVSVAEIWEQVQIDLDWSAKNYAADGCDLWEEVRSSDFFWDRYVTRAALSKGADFAAKQGDSIRSDTYRIAAKEIEDALSAHVDTTSASLPWIFESDSRKKDTAVIAALNNGYLDDGVYSPSSKEAAGSVQVLNELFCTSFQVNQDDSKNGVPGVLFGRYEGDQYAGGNPWCLLTSSLAELLYRGAAIVRADAADKQIVSSDDFHAWTSVVGISGGDDSTANRQALADAMVGAGDGVLLRLRSHVASGGFHLAEQLDRTSGESKSANDLTWSYAATLKAMEARKVYFA